LEALQSLTAVLLKTAANYLQRFLYNNRCQIPFTAVFKVTLKTAVKLFCSGFFIKTAVNFFLNSFAAVSS
jgi:hypothetical protein